MGIYDYVEGPLLLVAGLDLTAQELTDAKLAPYGAPIRTDVAPRLAADSRPGGSHRVEGYSLHTALAATRAGDLALTESTRNGLPTLSEQLVSLVLSRLRRGELELVLHNGTEKHFVGAEPGPKARVEIRDPRAATRLRPRPTSAWPRATWTASGTRRTSTRYSTLASRTWSIGPPPSPRPPRPSSERGTPAATTRRAAASATSPHHYDLGNDFYRLWLDDTMTYSSAMFDGDEDLGAAQVRKWDHLLDLLQPGPKDRILEIGCGWGGFAVHAAQAGRVPRHRRDALRGAACLGHPRRRGSGPRGPGRYPAAGLPCRPRDVHGDRVDRDVRSGRRALVAGVLPADPGPARPPAASPRSRRSRSTRPASTTTAASPTSSSATSSPAACCRAPRRFRAAAESCGLDVGDPVHFGGSYAKTLQEWRVRFEAAVPHVQELGFDERFIRMWRYYLRTAEPASTPRPST